MKKWFLIISGILLIVVMGIAIEINADLNELAKAFHSEHNLDDDSFVLLKSEISPNTDFQYYKYQFDNGGFGYSRVFWTVIENDTIIRDLTNGHLPDGYKAVGWTNENELVIEKWEPYYYYDEKVVLKSGDVINSVKLILKNVP